MAFPLVAGTVGEPTDVHAGMAVKRVRVATTGAGTLATSFENGDTVDGVVLATGDRVLLKNQATGADNGIRVVAASGTPARALDFDEDAEVLSGTLVVVSEGTVNADTIWELTTNAPITVGTTALVFAQYGGLLVDEDNMASDSATKVPSQQSVKAYVDAAGSGLEEVTIGASLFSSGITGGGTPTLGDASSAITGYMLGWLMDASSVERIQAEWIVPSGWATIDVDLWWTNAGAGSGDVRWRVVQTEYGDAVPFSSPTTILDTTSTITAPSGGTTKKSAMGTGGAVTPGRLVRLFIEREASNVADTLANDAAMLALHIRKAS